MSNLTKEQEFILFCIEAYKKQYKLKGEEVLDIFKNYDIFSFLSSGYDILHTQSMAYIVSEINELIQNRK